MTKIVRIENADISEHAVNVQVWQTSYDGSPDKLIREKNLLNPTDILSEAIWKQQYLVIREIDV